MSEQAKTGVEAGDRALETAREIRGMFGDGDNCAICKATVASIATLIQSAMNAQEREWAEALPLDAIRKYNELRALPADKFPGHRPSALANMVAFIGERVVAMVNAEAERLLAERGEKQ